MSKTKPDIDLEEIERLAGQGLTMKQIGHCVGRSKQTLYNHLDILDAIKKGRSQGIETVTNALMENAKGGNVTAQIFYLKNRQPDKWSDRRQTEVSGPGGKPIELLPFEFVSAEVTETSSED